MQMVYMCGVYKPVNILLENDYELQPQTHLDLFGHLSISMHYNEIFFLIQKIFTPANIFNS